MLIDDASVVKIRVTLQLVGAKPGGIQYIVQSCVKLNRNSSTMHSAPSLSVPTVRLRGSVRVSAGIRGMKCRP